MMRRAAKCYSTVDTCQLKKCTYSNWACTSLQKIQKRAGASARSTTY